MRPRASFGLDVRGVVCDQFGHYGSGAFAEALERFALCYEAGNIAIQRIPDMRCGLISGVECPYRHDSCLAGLVFGSN